jgi:HK97 family phage portal protein
VYDSAVKWPWSRREQPANTSLSITDPRLAALFSPGGTVDLAGVEVGEQSALGLSALFRGVSLISGTLASLPLRSLRLDDSGAPQQVPSVFDDPDGPDGQTGFEWKETLFAHLVIHGRAGALKVRNDAGALVRLPLVHPLCFYPELPTLDEYQSGRLPAGGLWFRVTLADRSQVRLDQNDFWYVPALAMTPGFGQGLMQTARRSLSTAIAGDKAAAKMFSSGALISGLATPTDEGLDISDDLPRIRREVNRSVAGWENAGAIAVVNRRLTFTPWTMTAQQAQFIESRGFQIEEISRWTGVPPHLLMQTDKQTSWGTGVDEQNRGLSKFVLGHWAKRVEERGSRLLARPRWCEFDFAGLERPNFETNVGLVLQQIAAGLISAEYGRKLLNIPADAAPAPAAAPTSGGGNVPAAQ